MTAKKKSPASPLRASPLRAYLDGLAPSSQR